MPAGPKGLQLPAGRLAAKRQAAGRPQVPQALAPVRKGVPVLPVALLLKEAPEEKLLPGDPIKTVRQRAETALDLDSPDSGIIDLDSSDSWIIGLWSLCCPPEGSQ